MDKRVAEIQKGQNMAVLKCKMCGGALNIEEGMTVCECEYCGTKQTVPNADDEKKMNLFNRANRLRFANEFDKAAGVLESIVAEFPEEAEAYWGLVLCSFGIEYVDDPKTGRKIPTCHRSSFDSVMDNPNFEMVMEYSDPVSRAVYRNEAKEIEELRKGIIEVSAKEKPYDIFICYKETDSLGERTIDSVIAQDVYDELTEKGYKVFFSRITLEDKLGQEYEPYIFAALNSSKIMLAFGTDYEYYNAVWVKNEWSRFLSLIEKGEKKTLIPCYKGIDAYDMPKEFAKLQAQDMGKVGAVQDLLRGIEKLIGSKQEKTTVQVPTAGPSVENLLTRGKMAVEDGKWDTANKFFDDALNYKVDCAEAYIGLLLVKYRKNNIEQLFEEKLVETVLEEPDFSRAREYADSGLSEILDKVYEAREQRLLEAQERASEIKKLNEVERKKVSEVSNRFTEYRKERVSFFHTTGSGMVGITLDGRVIATGDNYWGECNTQDWRDVVDVACGSTHIVGLTRGGRVFAIGKNEYGQCNTEDWKDIVDIACSGSHTVGLTRDGRVLATGSNGFYLGGEYRHIGRCDTGDWKDIVSVSCSSMRTVGTTTDGCVVITGKGILEEKIQSLKDFTSIYLVGVGDAVVGLTTNGRVVSLLMGDCDTEDWKDIIDIAFSRDHLAGLTRDGRVLATGKNKYGECNTEDWSDIVAIYCGDRHTVGLTRDGRVLATGDNEYGQCNTEAWADIVSIVDIECGFRYTKGLTSDGRIVSTESDILEQYNTATVKLFDDLDQYIEAADSMLALKKQNREELIAAIEERRRKEAELAKLMDKRRAQGLCQHCGGTLKGMLTKKCTSCGKIKDY